MARPLRFEYAGAMYHVTARGDGGKRVYETEADREDFVERLGRVCGSHGWRVHAWVLLANHFHLLLETPEPNLVTGMKTLMGGFSQAWNRRRERHGHVFQGRYKSVPVQGGEKGDGAVRMVADSIHLNPARAGLAGGKAGSLAGYRWSSLGAYARGQGPEWLETGRVLRAFDAVEEVRGRKAYVAWLEERAAQEGGRMGPAETKLLRRGWYLGGESFRDFLLGMIDEMPGAGEKGWRARGGEAMREHGEAEAERFLRRVLPGLGLPVEAAALATLRRGDERKVLVATALRRRTSVSNPWLAERLAMGHPGSVSRLTGCCGRDPARAEALARLVEA